MKATLNEILIDPEKLNDGCWSFFDWFCKETSLKKRAMSMLPKIRFLVAQGILNPNDVCVWFKNNCPMDGSLYDDFRINANNADVTYLGGFCPRTGHNGAEDKCEVWYFGDNKGLVTLSYKDWREFQNEVKSNLSLRKLLAKSFSIREE